MSRFRLISLCLLAAFSLAAVLLAPAGAEEPKKCGVESPSHWVYCYSNNDEIGNPVQDVSGTGGLVTMVANMGVEVRIECEKSTLAAELEPEGTGGGTLTLHNCEETNPAFCRLTKAEEKEIALQFAATLTGELSPGHVVADFSGTGVGEEIYELQIEDETSECAIPEGNYKITGKQKTELPSGESSLVEHEIVAKKSGSEWKIGESKATLSTKLKVKLSSTHEGESWHVGLST
jgi:hypothetical protein